MPTQSKRPPQLAFVSAGLLKPKKVDNGLAREHRYLNYGLLGLASITANAGYSCKVFHGLFDAPEEVAERVADQLLDESNSLVLLSIPSSFAICWARAFSEKLHQVSNHVRIIAGGRWVVGDDPDWLHKKIPNLDRVFGGTREDSILDIVENYTKNRSGRPSSKLAILGEGSNIFPRLDYSLLENPMDFHPSIEISRGCGMGCSFCVERSASLSPLRNPTAIIKEYRNVLTQTGREFANPYFECSFFRPTSKWQAQFQQELSRQDFSFEWRTESRVDSFSIEQLEGLRDIGLKVIDLGLESASPTQLLKMQKTTKPSVYLKRASQLLTHLHELGVWTKVNVLLYLGESNETIKETVDWINEHRKLIKGVSVNPLVLYRGLDDNSILNQIQDTKERLELQTQLNWNGYAFPDLSADFSSKEAMKFSTRLASDLMDGKDYYDLKSFSYLRPGFNWEDFVSICENAPPESLPFRWPSTNDLANRNTQSQSL